MIIRKLLFLCVLFTVLLFPVTLNAASSISDGFDYPVGKPDATEYYNAQGFGGTNNMFPGYHLGEDWNKKCNGNCDKGDPVYSISNGVVKFSKQQGLLWGRVIIVEHTLTDGSKYYSQYGHLNAADAISEGVLVKRGDKIGSIRDGIKTPSFYMWAHLHFEVRTDSNPNKLIAGPGYSSTPKPPGWVDPSDFINNHRPLPKSVLTVTETTDTTAKLSWTKPAVNNFQKYALYRSEVAGGTGAEPSRTLVSEFTNPDTLEHTDTNLTPEKDYFYKLFAFDNSGNFSESEEVSVKTTEKKQEKEDITNNEYHQNFPSIYKNRIVWEDGRVSGGSGMLPYLYYYDIEKKETLFKNISASGARGATNPIIYGDTVVFDSVNNKKSGLGLNVYMYSFEKDIATVVSENVGQQYNPDIYENFIVWQDERNGPAESDIYMMDASSGVKNETALAALPGRQTAPEIWGSKVVYINTIIGQASSKYDIMMLDIYTKEVTKIAEKMAYSSPSIDGGKVSWLNNKKVYVYDISTGATNIYEFKDVSVQTIKNDKIIYQSGLAEVTELHIYDINKKIDTVIAKMSKWNRSFDMFENLVVYSDTGPNEMSSSWADIFLLEL